MIISEFKGDYRWLSNFSPAEVVYDNHTFPTIEHAYVYSKTVVPEEQAELLSQIGKLSAGQVKRLGKLLTLRPDWELVRLDIMTDLTSQKYAYPFYRDKLLQTGDVEIVEGNTWGDTFWGKCNGVGDNNLGRIIMNARQHLKSK